MQEVFDIVKNHLLTQNEVSRKSLNIEEGPLAYQCAYRGPNNTKCAVGCLIPDELYNSSLEGKTVICADVIAVLVKAGFNVEDNFLALYSALQGVHDSYEPNRWPDLLRGLANRFKLNYE